ncbi:MAG TPA: hypothetical protein VGE81_06685 [Candidatus Limnocylindrales bacterium]
MALLLLKLVLTPILIGGASLAARRWGPSVGGWIVALPLTSGPVALYIALDHGNAFAAGAAKGSIAGLLGDATFALTYGWIARRAGWPVSVACGFAAFAATALAMQPVLSAPAVVVFATVALAMIVCLAFAVPPPAMSAAVPPPTWDIPARMIVGTGIVLAITAAAGALGPSLSGLLAAFPVYVTVLALFAHHLQGPEAAINVVRGLQVGLFGTIVFFLVVNSTIESLGVVVAFAVAIAAVAAVQSVSLRLVRRDIPTSVSAP